jgi:phage shock protein A
VNKFTNSITTPLERLQYLQEQKEEELRSVRSNVTDLHSSIKELEKNQENLLKSITDATEAAERAVAEGVDDAQVKKIIIRKNHLNKSYVDNQAYVSDTRAKLANLKALVKEYEVSIEEIKLQITQLNTESKISNVKVKIAETTAGLGDNDFQIEKNLAQGKEIVAKENARADAIMELKEEGLYGKRDDPVDSFLSESKADEELAAMKSRALIKKEE